MAVRLKSSHRRGSPLQRTRKCLYHALSTSFFPPFELKWSPTLTYWQSCNLNHICAERVTENWHWRTRREHTSTKCLSRCVKMANWTLKFMERSRRTNRQLRESTSNRELFHQRRKKWRTHQMLWRQAMHSTPLQTWAMVEHLQRLKTNRQSTSQGQKLSLRNSLADSSRTRGSTLRRHQVGFTRIMIADRMKSVA